MLLFLGKNMKNKRKNNKNKKMFNLNQTDY